MTYLLHAPAASRHEYPQIFKLARNHRHHRFETRNCFVYASIYTDVNIGCKVPDPMGSYPRQISWHGVDPSEKLDRLNDGRWTSEGPYESACFEAVKGQELKVSFQQFAIHGIWTSTYHALVSKHFRIQSCQVDPEVPVKPSRNTKPKRRTRF